MTSYQCLVVSREGRANWRAVEADSETGALALVRAEGLTALEIKAGSLSLSDRLNQPIGAAFGFGAAEQALMLKQFAMLVNSGLPVDRSLDLLRDQSIKMARREFLGEVLTGVRGGASLAQSLQRRSIFPAYVVGVIRSSERAGRLGEALTSLAERMNETSRTRRQLTTALTYPAAVLVATILALGVVLTVVVPQFSPIFVGEEERLPALTRAVLAMSDAVTRHGALILAIAVGGLICAWLTLRSAALSMLIEPYRSRIPGLKLRDQYLAAQFLGLLSTLLVNGVPILAALGLAKGAVGGARWRSFITSVESQVREGVGFSRAMASSTMIPSTAIRLIEVGERSGQLAMTCGQAGTIIADAAKARIDRAVSLANPIAIIVLGGVIAALVGGVMLGIFALGDFAG